MVDNNKRRKRNSVGLGLNWTRRGFLFFLSFFLTSLIGAGYLQTGSWGEDVFTNYAVLSDAPGNA